MPKVAITLRRRMGRSPVGATIQVAAEDARALVALKFAEYPPKPGRKPKAVGNAADTPKLEGEPKSAPTYKRRDMTAETYAARPLTAESNDVPAATTHDGEA